MNPRSKKRQYQDGCAVAQAMDIIGERWALFVMRELMFGPKRFSDLRASLPGISANVLTQRLEGLEDAGILVRRRLPPPAAAQVYDLTDWGREAEPLFRVIGRWAARSPSLCPAPMSIASVVLSMRTMFDARRAGDLAVTGELRFDDQRFALQVADGNFRIAPGAANDPDFVLGGDQNALAALLYGGIHLVAAERELDLWVEGDRALLGRFLSLFPLPEPAPVGDCARQDPRPLA